MTNDNDIQVEPEPTSAPPGRYRYTESLPPGAIRVPRQGIIREVKDETGKIIRTRPVSLDIVEAREKRMDYFHEEFGWLIDGFKPERDRSVEDRMADRSTSLRTKPSF